MMMEIKGLINSTYKGKMKSIERENQTEIIFRWAFRQNLQHFMHHFVIISLTNSKKYRFPFSFAGSSFISILTMCFNENLTLPKI